MLADVPAGDYDVITLQGALCERKTVRRQQVEQGNLLHQLQPWCFWTRADPSPLILADHEVTEDAGSALAFQLLYSGNFEGFVQRINSMKFGLIGNQSRKLLLGVGTESEL